MNFSKDKLIILLALILAFAWGFRRSAPEETISPAPKNSTAVQTSIPTSAPAPEEVPSLPTPKPIRTSEKATSEEEESDLTEEEEAANPPNPYENMPVAIITPESDNNPYAGMAGKSANGSLENALDSSNAGELRRQQLEQRNLYFQKLSQELKELQGEPEPEVSNAPTTSPAKEAGKNPSPSEAAPPTPTEPPLIQEAHPLEQTEIDSTEEPIQALTPEQERELEAELSGILDEE